MAMICAAMWRLIYRDYHTHIEITILWDWGNPDQSGARMAEKTQICCQNVTDQHTYTHTHIHTHHTTTHTHTHTHTRSHKHRHTHTTMWCLWHSLMCVDRGGTTTCQEDGRHG